MFKPKNRFVRRRSRTRFALRQANTDRPRLSIHRSGKHIYAQIIDDVAGKTLAAASSLDAGLRGELKNGGDVEAAKRVGALVAERAKTAGVEAVIFDRGGFKFHGRVKALAEGAREGGLNF